MTYPASSSAIIGSLNAEGYTVDETLNHNELTSFVARYLFRKNRITIGFLFFISGFFIIMLYAVVLYCMKPFCSTIDIVYQILLGILSTIILVIPHELLHGLGYKICGAGKITYIANWKKLYFMAAADKFVVNRSKFTFIAMLPFFIISICLLLCGFIYLDDYMIVFVTGNVVHATMCAGDAGLLSYFEENNGYEMITFDNLEDNETYFLKR